MNLNAETPRMTILRRRFNLIRKQVASEKEAGVQVKSLVTDDNIQHFYLVDKSGRILSGYHDCAMAAWLDYCE